MSEVPAARPLLACADDFGLSAAVDRGIARLVDAGRLGAFSCLAGAPAWAADAPLGRRLRARAQVGLHLNLTEGRPLSPALARLWPQLPALPRLIADAHLGRLPLHAIADELAAQWQAVADGLGSAPDFVDGHQHVHHLPGVRGLLLAWLQRHPVPVRSTARLGGPGFALKRQLIAGTGGRALARGLQRQRLPHNRLLLGAYDFAATDYRALMRAWLARVPAEGALLFCHPGEAAAPGDAPDAIAAARVRELAYFASPAWPQDLVDAGVTLAPAWR
jgi:predicted glycoside hydrolase/deacetylase ChbG (UPF0249 family)